MYTGYNALSVALAMPENGLVVACEIEDTYIEIARPFFKEVRSVKKKKKIKTKKKHALYSVS